MKKNHSVSKSWIVVHLGIAVKILSGQTKILGENSGKKW